MMVIMLILCSLLSFVGGYYGGLNRASKEFRKIEEKYDEIITGYKNIIDKYLRDKGFRG